MEKKKILIIAATHGDEAIGLEATNKLKKKGLDKYFDVLIANPKALAKNARSVDVDLNRSYPGNKKSVFYEERIAYDNLKVAKNYKYIIDMHEADEGKDDFIIVPRENLSDLFPLDLIDLQKVLLWPDPKGPLSQVLENAIELEFGIKNRDRKELIAKATKILENFILGTNGKKISFSKKDIYYVYGKLMKQDSSFDMSQMRDFIEIENNKEKFYPLLVGQYLRDNIVCYKMRKK